MSKKSSALAIVPRPAMKHIKMPKCVLKEGVVYSGDNGRLICCHCAGMAATYSGRDLSGHKVTPMEQEDADQWMMLMDAVLACECGRTKHLPTLGTTFSPDFCRQMFGEGYAPVRQRA